MWIPHHTGSQRLPQSPRRERSRGRRRYRRRPRACWQFSDHRGSVGGAVPRPCLALARRLRRLVSLAIVEGGTEALDSLAPQPWQDMAVGVERDADLALPQPLLHHLQVHPLPEHPRRVGVPQVVEADVRQVGRSWGPVSAIARRVSVDPCHTRLAERRMPYANPNTTPSTRKARYTL